MIKKTYAQHLKQFPNGFRQFSQDIKLTGVPRIQFLRSEWESIQFQSTVVSVPYLLYRLVFFLYFIVFLILSITNFESGAYWPLLATNWTFLAQTLYATLNLVNVCSFWVQEKCYRNHPFYHLNVNWFESTTWFFMNLSYAVPQFISITYWLFVHGKSGSNTPIGFSLTVHGINAVLVIIDAMVVASPLNVTHFVYPIIVNFIYVVFTGLYEVAGGPYMSEDQPYIYPILNWKEDWPMAIVTGVVSLSTITCFHFLFWILVQTRIFLASKYHENEPSGLYDSDDFSNNHNNPNTLYAERKPLLDKSQITKNSKV